MLDLYKNIRILREEKGLSQEELAKLCGYTSRSTIAKIEKGKVDLPHSKILAFANALETTPGKLMGLIDYDLINSMSTITTESNKFNKKYTEKQNIKTIPQNINVPNTLINNSLKLNNENTTIAAHFDGSEFTKDELDDIRAYADFVKNKRKK